MKAMNPLTKTVVLMTIIGPVLAQQVMAQNQEDFGPTPELPSSQATVEDAAAPAATQTAAVPSPSPGPIAATEGEQPGMRIEVTELKRGSGDTVTLKFKLINESEDSFYLGANGMREVYLLDTPNRKKYHVITGADRKCVCGSDVTNFVFWKRQRR